MERALMVKQYMGRVRLASGCLANVYVSGKPGHYVFRPLVDEQSEGGLEFVYAAKDLKPKREWPWVV